MKQNEDDSLIQDENSTVLEKNKNKHNANNSKHDKDLLYEKNATIEHLQQQVAQLTNQISNLTHTDRSSYKNKTQNKKNLFHTIDSYAVDVSDGQSKCGKRRQLVLTATPSRQKIGRHASIATTNALERMQQEKKNDNKNNNMEPIYQRVHDMFKEPEQAVHYLSSELFAKDILTLCKLSQRILQDEPRCIFLQSPAYIFGDIHGNLEDLHFFSDNIWRLGMSLTAGSFVFLGDYVDRGLSCLECVAYLLTMKCSLPRKVTLLRGNHETRDVNGWEEHYGERSFIAQCRKRFGDELGFLVWEEANKTFDRMPLSCVIDQDIFCVHGGIPRSISQSNKENTTTASPYSFLKKNNSKNKNSDTKSKSRIQEILTVPRIAGVNPPYEHENEEAQQIASDCIWSDPASEDQEQTCVDPQTGFGASLRGGGAICFGHKAVTDFLAQHNYSYIMRAHEAHAEGVAVSKGARVFTVFSTSKDHNQGSRALAGCMLVDNEKLQVINRSPAYRNQYVHRRDSVSLNHLTQSELELRERVGLVIEQQPSLETYDEDEEYQEEEDFCGEWEDMEEDIQSNNHRHKMMDIMEEINEQDSEDE